MKRIRARPPPARHIVSPGRVPGGIQADLFLGTFLPCLRAFDKPMAIACLRLLTLPAFPPRPLRAVPRLYRRISDSTSRLAPREYFRFRFAIAFSKIFLFARRVSCFRLFASSARHHVPFFCSTSRKRQNFVVVPSQGAAKFTPKGQQCSPKGLIAFYLKVSCDRSFAQIVWVRWNHMPPSAFNGGRGGLAA